MGGRPIGGGPVGGPFGMGGGPFRRGPYGGVGPIFVGGPRVYRRSRGPVYSQPPVNPNADRGGGCGCAAAIVVVVLFLVFSYFLFNLSLCSGASGYGDTTVTEIPASTWERKALPLDEATQTAFYQDADGSWISDPAAMEKGLREFWQKTGVYPFVFIAPNGELTTPQQCTQLAQQIYPQITDDQAHLVLVFCDDNQGSFIYGYDLGSDASTVLDQEALSILVANLGRYYDTAPTEEGVFSDAFADTATRIMRVDQPWYVEAMPIIIGVIGVIVLVVVISSVRTRRREREAHVREVLNQPLEKYGDQELEELEKKYTTDADGDSDWSLDRKEADLEARYADLERRERDLRDTSGDDD